MKRLILMMLVLGLAFSVSTIGAIVVASAK
jgi:hypothetical protein